MLILAVVILGISGCTERERMGYSAIPQNSPGAWELNPYGSLQN